MSKFLYFHVFVLYMKIYGNFSKLNMTLAGIAAGTMMLFPTQTKAQGTTIQAKPDTFEIVEKVTPQGTDSEEILFNAPSPDIKVLGEYKTAKIIIDLSKNILYKYDEFGNPEKAYLVASGKKGSPTDTGVRIVTHIETYPYKTAPWSTKRRRNPKAYGPKIICLDKLNPLTGERSRTGEFIHGNNNPNSLGKYASLGCVRMDNEVIKELSTQVKRGDIVIIKK